MQRALCGTRKKHMRRRYNKSGRQKGIQMVDCEFLVKDEGFGKYQVVIASAAR